MCSPLRRGLRKSLFISKLERIYCFCNLARSPKRLQQSFCGFGYFGHRFLGIMCILPNRAGGFGVRRRGHLPIRRWANPLKISDVAEVSTLEYELQVQQRSDNLLGGAGYAFDPY